MPAAVHHDTATHSADQTGSGPGSKTPEAAFPFLGPPTEPGDLGTLGGYRVLRLLGEGGMGYVFHAEDTQLRRPVAMKVMKPSAAAGATGRERFLREGRAAAGLKSDHVVTIYQVGEENGVAFLAMEYLDGANLEDWVRARDGTASVSAGLRILRDVLRGLAAAHAKGMVHRDIKPANLWVESSTGRVKVLDFGLTRAVSGEDQLTAEGALVGTPSYMAPEQARSQPVDARADLFSAGVVLYRMLTGVSPFQRGDTIGTLTALAIETPPSADRVNAAVPADVCLFLERMMSKAPAGRPADAKKALYELTVIRKRHQQEGGVPPEPNGNTNLVPLSFEPELPHAPPAAPTDARPTAPLPARPVARPPRPRGNEPAPDRRPRSGRLPGVAVGVGITLLGCAGLAGLAIGMGWVPTAVLSDRDDRDDRLPPTDGRKLVKPDKPADGTVPSDLTVAIAPAMPVTKPASVPTTVKPKDTPVVKDPVPSPDPDRTATRCVLALGGTVDVLVKHGVSGRTTPARVSRAADVPTEDFKLITVDLQETGATDADLRVFGNCSHLGWVRLSASKVTRQGVEQLSSRHPQCLVEWDDAPAGKWFRGGAGRLADAPAPVPAPVAVRDPDRAAAEFILSGGGSVDVYHGLTSVRANGPADLPAGLIQLKSADASSPRLQGTVGDTFMPVLAACQSLKGIDLSGTGVTDAGLAPLRECRGLGWIRLTGTNVTAAGVGELRKSLPGCWITWEPADGLPAPSPWEVPAPPKAPEDAPLPPTSGPKGNPFIVPPPPSKPPVRNPFLPDR